MARGLRATRGGGQHDIARFGTNRLAYYGDASQGVSGATFTRSTTATYPDVSGVTQTAGINVLRNSAYFGGNRTVELEGASTNHFLNSGAPVTQTSPSLATGSYTIRCTGTATCTPAGTTATITGSATSSAGTDVTFVVTVAGTVTYTVTGSGTVQVENLAFASSYIPTAGVSVTRSADSYSVPFTPLPQAMTLYTKFVDRGTSATANQRILQIGEPAGNTNSIRIIAQDGTPGKYIMYHDDGSANVFSAVTSGALLGSTVEALGQWFADGSVQLTIVVNGGAPTVGAQSAAKALPAFFGSAGVGIKLGLNNSSGGSVPGYAAFLVPYKVAAGVRTLQDMRNL